MREYCEEEMWVWGFPNHKCQKFCQITSRRRVICKEFFGMSDLENPILTFPISQYSHCRKLQICIKWEKTRDIAAKCWVKLMFTLCDDWQFFWNYIIVKCEHDFLLFHSFATIVVFYNANCLINKHEFGCEVLF